MEVRTVTSYNGYNAQLKSIENNGWKKFGWDRFRGYNNTDLDYAIRRAYNGLLAKIHLATQPDYDYLILKGGYVNETKTITWGLSDAFVKYRAASCRNKDNGNGGDNGDDKPPSDVWKQIMDNWWILAIVAVVILVGVIR